MTPLKQASEDLVTLKPVGLSFALLLLCGYAMVTLGWTFRARAPPRRVCFSV
jgi:hypothetical protein